MEENGFTGMAKIVLMVLSSFLLAACPAETFDLHNLTVTDRKAPVMEGFRLYANRIASVDFDEPVVLVEALLGDERLKCGRNLSRLQNIDLERVLEAGSEERLSFTVENGQGNTARFSIPVAGINLNQAHALITELSTKGTKSSPDRIELHITKDGSTAGLCVADAIIGQEDHRFHLPDLDVKKNDIIVISWDHETPGGERVEKDGLFRIYHMDAGSGRTLQGNNGGVILYSHINGQGKIMDALPYNSPDAVMSDGFGNEKSRLSVQHLIGNGQWEGGTVDSDEVTTSRVIARYWPYQDSNTKDDFYITAARNSTFGRRNTNVIHNP